MKLIPERLIEARANADLTQQALADRAGLSKTSIAGYESGKLFPRKTTIYRLARTLGMDVSFLTEPSELSDNADDYNLKALLRTKSPLLKTHSYEIAISPQDIPPSEKEKERLKMVLERALIYMKQEIESMTELRADDALVPPIANETAQDLETRFVSALSLRSIERAFNEINGEAVEGDPLILRLRRPLKKP